MIKKTEVLLDGEYQVDFTVKRGQLVSVYADKQHNLYKIEVECEEAEGNRSTVVTARYNGIGFSFKPLDVKAGFPLYYKERNVIIREESDRYDFDNIQEVLYKKPLKKQATYQEAKKKTGGIQSCPTVLGIAGDVRTFEIGFRKMPIEEKQHMDLYDYIVPHNNWKKASCPEFDIEGITYRYLMGRGIGGQTNIKRRLLGGYLPILTATVKDDGLDYNLTAYVTTLGQKNEGTPYLLADLCSAASAFSEEQQKEAEKLEHVGDAPVLMAKVEIVNNQPIAKLSYMRLPHINTWVMAEGVTVKEQYFDCEKGLGKVGEKVYLKARINGKIANGLEHCIKLNSGEKCVFEWVLFHTPVTEQKSENVNLDDFDKFLKAEIKTFKKRQKSLAKIQVPEKRLEEMWKANYFQISQNCFGKEGDGVIAPALGVYCAIASEGSNIINVLASSGDFDRAKKCVNYFFKKQRPNGFIQNMKGYMLETGGALNIANEVWLYTRDREWLENLKEGIKKACKYIFSWIDKNSVEDGRKGYGMIDGQVADPVDNYRLYMLNSYAYAGLKGATNLLGVLNDQMEAEVKTRAQTLKKNILLALKESLISAPLSPMDDGSYLPLLPAWAEADGASCLHLEGEISTTHASVVLKDSLLSVPYLLKFGVVDLDDQIADIILKSQKSLFMQDCSPLSEPYYSCVPYVDIAKGNIDDFISEFYYSMTASSDRETYSFWEHTFLATPHKTSEQAAFQFRMRSIFAYEDFDKNILVALRAVPNAWKKCADNTINVQNLHTMMGEMSVKYRTVGMGEYEIAYNFLPYDDNTVLRLYLPIKEGEKSDREYVDVQKGKGVIKWTTK